LEKLEGVDCMWIYYPKSSEISSGFPSTSEQFKIDVSQLFTNGNGFIYA
jgi:hypothetical protein